MRTLTVKIAAGSTEELAVKGDYVRLRSAPYDVILENPETSEKVEGSQGDDFELSPFKRLKVTNTGGVDSIFKLTISQGKKAGSAQVAGNVAVSGGVNINSQIPVQATGGTTQKTVTNASASLVAANALREYLLIQNKDAAGNVYIVFNAAATVAAGVKIPPGGSFELNSNILTAQIFAIGDITNNANVVVVEG